MSSEHSRRIDVQECAILVIDMQERLLPAMHDPEGCSAQCVKLIQGAKTLGVPILWTEQYRKGLGPTVPEIAEAIGDAASPMEKMCFGCLDNESIRSSVEKLGRSHLVLCGIESHVCVLQTALHAMELGLKPVLAEDAVSSRRATDRAAGIARLYQAGVIPGTVEMLLMEWLRVAGTDTFKKMLPLFKS